MVEVNVPDGAGRLRTALVPRTSVVDAIYLRLLGSAVLITVAMFLDVSTATQIAVIAICAADFAASLLWRHFWRRNPQFPVVVFSAAEGIAGATVLSYVEPAWTVAALFAYLLTIVYVSGMARRLPVVVLAALCLVLAFVREVTLPEDLSIGAFNLAMFAFTLVALIAYSGSRSFGSSRTTESLQRLHEALRTVTSEPELAPTLESITTAARTALRGEIIVIQLREDDHLVLAAGGYTNDRFTDDAVRRYTRWELATIDKTPLARSVNLGETVVVPDLTDDPRFPEWIEGFRGRQTFEEARALVTVPLGTGDKIIGAMSAFFRDPVLADKETVQLLQTYAEHVTLLIVRTQAYDREHQLTARLREADRLKSEFVALASHQLRTPLTATKGFIDTVLFQWDRLDDSTRQNMLQRAAVSADDLGRMLSQLLDLSRIESEDTQLDIGPLRLGDVVRETVAAMTPLLRHEIVVTVPDDLVVAADRDALRHVLDNLLANAVKFSPPGSRVSVVGSRDDDEVLVEVVDEGPGIPLDEQDRIFERFYRGMPSRGAGGTGLGLSIAQRYAEALGGRIWVESEPDAGASFVVALPDAATRESNATPEVERATH